MCASGWCKPSCPCLFANQPSRGQHNTSNPRGCRRPGRCGPAAAGPAPTRLLPAWERRYRAAQYSAKLGGHRLLPFVHCAAAVGLPRQRVAYKLSLVACQDCIVLAALKPHLKLVRCQPVRFPGREAAVGRRCLGDLPGAGRPVDGMIGNLAVPVPAPAGCQRAAGSMGTLVLAGAGGEGALDWGRSS